MSETGNDFTEGEDILLHKGGNFHLGVIIQISDNKCLVKFGDGTVRWSDCKDLEKLTEDPESDDVKCEICDMPDIPGNEIIFCNSCSCGYHKKCHKPVIKVLENWLCSRCKMLDEKAAETSPAKVRNLPGAVEWLPRQTTDSCKDVTKMKPCEAGLKLLRIGSKPLLLPKGVSMDGLKVCIKSASPFYTDRLVVEKRIQEQQGSNKKAKKAASSEKMNGPVFPLTPPPENGHTEKRMERSQCLGEKDREDDEDESAVEEEEEEDDEEVEEEEEEEEEEGESEPVAKRKVKDKGKGEAKAKEELKAKEVKEEEVKEREEKTVKKLKEESFNNNNNNNNDKKVRDEGVFKKPNLESSKRETHHRKMKMEPGIYLKQSLPISKPFADDANTVAMSDVLMDGTLSVAKLFSLDYPRGGISLPLPTHAPLPVKRRRLSEKDIRINKNGEVKRRSLRKVAPAAAPPTQECVIYNAAPSHECPCSLKRSIYGRVKRDDVLTKRVAQGESFSVFGKRTLEDGSVQYLIEWESSVKTF